MNQFQNNEPNALEILAFVVSSYEAQQDKKKPKANLKNQQAEPGDYFKPKGVVSSGLEQHRVSCHRCGNIRKRKLFCCRPSCPHIFCGRCADKMKEDYGPAIFNVGCPVCQELCCCSNKSTYCDRKNHCYRKCPASRSKSTELKTDGFTYNKYNSDTTRNTCQFVSRASTPSPAMNSNPTTTTGDSVNRRDGKLVAFHSPSTDSFENRSSTLPTYVPTRGRGGDGKPHSDLGSDDAESDDAEYSDAEIRPNHPTYNVSAHVRPVGSQSVSGTASGYPDGATPYASEGIALFPAFYGYPMPSFPFYMGGAGAMSPDGNLRADHSANPYLAAALNSQAAPDGSSNGTIQLEMYNNWLRQCGAHLPAGFPGPAQESVQAETRSTETAPVRSDKSTATDKSTVGDDELGTAEEDIRLTRLDANQQSQSVSDVPAIDKKRKHSAVVPSRLDDFNDMLKPVASSQNQTLSSFGLSPPYGTRLFSNHYQHSNLTSRHAPQPLSLVATDTTSDAVLVKEDANN